MESNNQKQKIDSAVNEWSKYIELFGSSKVSAQYLWTKGHSWDEIIKIYRDAISENKEIDLMKLNSNRENNKR